MRRAGGSLALLLAAGVTAALVGAAASQQRGPPKAQPRLSDIPYIKCQVCELLAKNAWKQVKEMKKATTPSDKVDEMKIIERMEKITTAWRPEGEWIASLDLVEEGSKLVVREMDQVGNCDVECKTVERAAEQIMGEHDTDIAEVLFTGKKNRAQLSNWLCYELTGVCKSKPPPLPKDRAPGPAFQPQKEGDQNLERMMGQMQDQGLRGSLYSREDLMAKYGMPEGHKDDDEEEEVEGSGSAGIPTTPAPVPAPLQRAVEQAQGAVRGAAAAARDGLRVAAQKARGLWDAFQARQEQPKQQEL